MNFKNKIANKISRKLNELSHKYYKLPNIDYTKKIAYVVGVSNHPNAGDQEITLAQKKFIKKYIPDFIYVEIEKEKITYIIDELAKKIKPGDIVFIQGGGTVSDLYPEHEKPRQLLLDKLKNSSAKIIQFPISFHYEDIDSFREIKNIYNEAGNFTLFARESKSYNILKKELTIPVFHIPDIVLSQNESSDMKRGNKILIMFRSDMECLLPKQKAEDIINYFSRNNDVLITDNYVENYVLTFESNREKLLSKKFNEFREAKLIITDRLHGMIFAYITKTPAIVFDNSYGKVKNSYKDWLSDSNYIKFIDAESTTIEEVIELARNLSADSGNFTLDLQSAFSPLIKLVRQDLKG
ncbi:polysaccharide pyruvyl transferase family protein [Klebsiella sp. RHBSTW-00465]|uniref:polysaccharide pyruvyl transferase family protein n=1 Tax=Klebsiella sp. RHBSTW-00465 TaxID=2742650 RepID=UPI0015F4CAD1|nr:polysaccharide pyruvyl transferase family protein [Klebsiella sp. RHBSTW-00465]MBA7847938.1 polysaccharide pyruvyl transferase family protein [Klebsiella sp. RHBSTW-00465]